ncbi:MAG: class I SAM-dependent methyltransferase, partial [Nocardiopsis sp. BM-2018]
MTATRPRPDGTIAFRATLARSVGLFSAFRKEQTDPAFFYGELARDTVDQLRSYTPLDGKLVVDVGGGPGYFADALRATGARCLCVDSDAHEMTLHGREADANAVQGSALDLPLQTGTVDVCFSSNVLEHVPDRTRMA